MPRASSKKLTKKKPAHPEWKRINERARLERQLAGVIEPSNNEYRITNNEQKEKRKGAEGADGQERNSLFVIRDSTVIPSARDYDVRLIEHLSKKTTPKARKVPVRMGEHEPSPYVVEMGGLARKVVVDEREPEFENVDAWEAPYEEPPSMETLTSMASDLYLGRISPSLWYEQYTPGDADVAYQERYGLVSRIKAPLIRWEARNASSEREFIKVKNGKQVLDKLFAEQFEPDKHTWMDSVRHFLVESFAKAKATEEEIITETEQAWGVPVLVPRLAPARVLVGFVALAFLVSLPAGAVSIAHSLGASWGEVSSSGRDAADAAQSAVAAGPSVEAGAWGRVSDSLEATDQALNRVNALAVVISETLPETRDAYRSARSVLHAGDLSAQAASLLTQGLDRALTEPTRYPVDRLRVFRTYLDSAIPLIEEADASMHEVSPEAVPDAQRAQVQEATTLLTTARQGLREFKAITDLMITGVGDEHRKSYLLIFQNSTELRPTGGFMGSLAQVTLDRGTISKLDVPGGGPYDVRNQLTTRALPPEPLRLVSTRWEFQDANWFPDYPAAATKIRRFWSEAGQPTVDGVIAINLDVMEELLAVVGPIDMPEYGKTVNAENFWIETQKAVELEYDREENKPKKFIGDLMPKVLEKVKSLSTKEEGLKLLTLISGALQRKDIQVWFADAEQEALAERFGWSGRFKDAPGDSLAIIDTNIAGQKTDREIDERVLHRVDVGADGSMTDTVTIVRTHTGARGELFNGVNNVNYLRVYVPQGSELLAADGFKPPPDALFKTPLASDLPDPDVTSTERNARLGPNGVRITDEFNRTAFGGWVQLMPGETATTTFTYRLPFTAYDIAERLRPDGAPTPDARRPAYVVLYTSQSGKNDRRIVTDLHVPANWQSVWTSNDVLDQAWDQDRALGGLFVVGK